MIRSLAAEVGRNPRAQDGETLQPYVSQPKHSEWVSTFQHGSTWFNMVQLCSTDLSILSNFITTITTITTLCCQHLQLVRTLQTWAALVRPPELHPRDMDLRCSGSVDHRDTWALTQCLAVSNIRIWSVPGGSRRLHHLLLGTIINHYPLWKSL